MNRTDALIIGAGQAGLAMSRALKIRGIEHVVLERGRIGERWRSERWDSLHLLTTSSYSALPGLDHLDVDPESFMSAAGFANYLDRYAEAFAVPVIRGAEVTAVEASQGGYQVATSTRIWRARSVIIATVPATFPIVRNRRPISRPRSRRFHRPNIGRPRDCRTAACSS
jgi:putative flavoprotein involved in K+ transport